MKQETVAKMTDAKLLEKLEIYDQKYYDAITHKKPHENWGYGMRAYHSFKTVSYAKQDNARDNAIMILKELENRGIKGYTRFVK